MYAIIALSVLVWWLLRFIPMQKYHPYPPTRDLPTATILVRANTTPAQLSRTIKFAQRERPYEVIVVSNQYRHGIEAVCRDADVRLLEREQGAEEAAIAEAWGSIVVILDGDAMLTPGALETLLYPFDDDDIGGVAGQVFVRSLGKNFADWLHRIRASVHQPSQSVIGRATDCHAYRRATLMRGSGNYDRRVWEAGEKTVYQSPAGISIDGKLPQLWPSTRLQTIYFASSLALLATIGYFAIREYLRA